MIFLNLANKLNSFKVLRLNWFILKKLFTNAQISIQIYILYKNKTAVQVYPTGFKKWPIATIDCAWTISGPKTIYTGILSMFQFCEI